MDKVLLKLWTQNSDLTEIFQSVVIKLAHVNSNYEQVHQPGKCRDFLGDMMWSRYWKKPVYIYGLRYDFSKNPYDTEVTRLSLEFPNQVCLQNFLKNIGYLHNREDLAGVSRSVVLETQHDQILVIEGDKAWQGCVWKLSLYTYYIKLMSYDDPNKPLAPENRYKEELTSSIEEVYLNNIKSDYNPIAKELQDNHNSSGFVSVAHYYNEYHIYKEYPYFGIEVVKNLFDVGSR